MSASPFSNKSQENKKKDMFDLKKSDKKSDKKKDKVEKNCSNSKKRKKILGE